jgi:hypothetical protein
VVAAKNFNVVLGRGRGSVSAQTQRDLAEIEARELVLDRWIYESNKIGCSQVCANALIVAYSDTRRERTDTEGEWYDDFKKAAYSKVEKDRAFEPIRIARLIKFGDPVGWPGLTAPAIKFMGWYCSASEPAPSGAVVEIVIDKCFLEGINEESEFEYLQPLIDDLATVIKRTPVDVRPVCVRAASVLRVAPTSALVGSLVSWVQAFATRIDNGMDIEGELKVLQSAVTLARGPLNAEPDAKRVAALAPVASALSARNLI